MIKIGFIDRHLSNWHADNYPSLIEKCSEGRMKVCFAYGMPDVKAPSGISNAEWAEKNGIELLPTIDEVIEKSDRLVVLSPDNPEAHPFLCEKPLKSGKRTYIDKTFADDRATAEAIFAIAEASGTPCFTSSALHFADEYQALYESRGDIVTMQLLSPSVYEIYSIHMIEPIVRLMDEPAKRVMCVGEAPYAAVVIEFESGRTARISNFPARVPMLATIGKKERKVDHFEVTSPYFDNFIRAMVKFFDDGEIPVPHFQTVQVIAIRAAGLKALEKPFEWVNV